MVSATWPDMPDPGGTVNVVPTVPVRSNSLDNNNSTASCCFSNISGPSWLCYFSATLCLRLVELKISKTYFTFCQKWLIKPILDF